MITVNPCAIIIIAATVAVMKPFQVSSFQCHVMFVSRNQQSSSHFTQLLMKMKSLLLKKGQRKKENEGERERERERNNVRERNAINTFENEEVVSRQMEG